MHTHRLVLIALLPLASAVLLVPSTSAAPATCDGLDATIVGTGAADDLTGTDGPDVVSLLGGRDTFRGRGGDDVICGGSGDDRIYPGKGDDTVLAGDGADRVYEGPGDDHVDGQAGHDELLYSSSGVNNPPAGAKDLRLDARIGKATSSNGTDTFSSFDRYVGTRNTDRLIGSGTDEIINGYGGADDAVDAFGGDDQIFVTRGSPAVDAGDGDDVVHTDGVHDVGLRLGKGDDTIVFSHPGPGTHWDGGPGSDTLWVHGTGSEYNLNQGFIKVYTSGVRWGINGFENVIASDATDRIVGNAEANRLESRGGNDTLIGLGGDDVLIGFSNSYYDDQADGGAGRDVCRAWKPTGCERVLPRVSWPYHWN